MSNPTVASFFVPRSFNSSANAEFALGRSLPRSIDSGAPATQPAVSAWQAAGDGFETSHRAQAAALPPPPLEGRTPAGWQRYCEQFRETAQNCIGWKTASSIPDKELEHLLRTSGGPVQVGAWSTTPGRENTPVFFRSFPSDQDMRAQVYAYPDTQGTWRTFEIAGSILDAYKSPGYLDGRLGTSSALGFPRSGHEFAQAGAQAFTADPEVAAAIQRDGRVGFQNFENGFLVELGGGKVQAFDRAGQRLGTSHPGGKLSASAAPPQPEPPSTGGPIFPGINPLPEYRSNYQAYEVVPGVSVPSRIGVHWGPRTDYSNTERIDMAAQMLAERGVGYSTVVVNPQTWQTQLPSIEALLEKGIQPAVRLLPAGSYGDPAMDQLNDAQLREMARAAIELSKRGVKIVQLDNEPNSVSKRMVDIVANKDSNPEEFKKTMYAYADHVATVMRYIHEGIPGEESLGKASDMAVGFGALNPMGIKIDEQEYENNWKTFHESLLWEMKYQNERHGGHLLDKAFLAVHPYTIGWYKDEDRGNSQGIELSEWMEQDARRILGVPIKTLATEGGNPAGNGINVTEMKFLQKYPESTQCYWIVGNQFLLGGNDSWEATEKAGGHWVKDGERFRRATQDEFNKGLGTHELSWNADWEADALMWVDDGKLVTSRFFDTLHDVAHNKQPT